MTNEIEHSLAVLGLPTTASKKDVTRAYRRLAQKYHPDRCTEPDAGEIFKMIKAAYNRLKDYQHTIATGAADWSHLSRNPGNPNPTHTGRVPRPEEVDVANLKSAVLTTAGWLVPNR